MCCEGAGPATPARRGRRMSPCWTDQLRKWRFSGVVPEPASRACGFGDPHSRAPLRRALRPWPPNRRAGVGRRVSHIPDPKRTPVEGTGMQSSQPQQPPAAPGTGPSAALTHRHSWWASDPTVRYVAAVAKGGAAALVLYGIFLLGEVAVDLASSRVPVASSAPALFLRLVFSWGGAIASAATWVAVTFSELRELIRAYGQTA